MHLSTHRAKMIAVICFALAMLAASARAVSSYTISWIGTIQPEGSFDPWNLGLSPTDFMVAVDLPFDAADYSSLDIQNASYDLSISRLWIGGEPAPYVGPSAITFSDGGVTEDGSLLPDLIIFGGEYALNGNLTSFSSGLGIDSTSFTFTRLVEPPPILASTFVTVPGQALGLTYRTTVAGGTAVTVVPEPTGLCLLLLTMPAIQFHLCSLCNRL